MYVNPSVGRLVLSRAIGSVFVIATAVIICIIKEEFNERRKKKLGSGAFPGGSVRGSCERGNQGQRCRFCGCSEKNNKHGGIERK